MVGNCSSYVREKKEREIEREGERDSNVENLLESKNLVLIDEDGHKIITFKFT
jgi:hypothetical protein